MISINRFRIAKAIKLTPTIALLIFSLGGYGEGPVASGTNTPEQKPVAPDKNMSQQKYLAELGKLNVLWKNDQIDGVVIVHVQSSSQYAIEFSPSRLDSEGPFRLFIRYPATQNLTKEVFYRMQRLTIKEAAGEPALRWGIIFFNSKKERVFSVYLGRDGSEGVINDSPVKFSSDDLYSFLESTLGNVLN